MSHLTEFELAILKQAAGLDDEGKGPKTWGAAVGVAGEHLRGCGLMKRDGTLTERGKLAACMSYEELSRQRKENAWTT